MIFKAKKILYLTAEVAPYVRVGGLSQVMYFLPRAMKRRGFDVRIFTPKYGVTELKNGSGDGLPIKNEVTGLTVPVNGQDSTEEFVCNVLSTRSGKNEALVYFLENREYFELRANVYGYSDDPTRFALLAKGCLEWLLHEQKRLKAGETDVWVPSIVHCHDWHTSYFIELARCHPRYKSALEDVTVVLTVHNLKYQGAKDFRFLRDEEKDDGLAPLEPINSERLLNQNALLRGLLHADAVTTVSPSHVKEILTVEYAEGLLEVLTKIQRRLSGILNGLDIQEFNPAVDKVIKRRYSAFVFESARRENKADLQKEFELPQKPDAPILAFSGRLVTQKGIDLIIEALPHLLEERDDMQFIFLGGGDDKFCNSLNQLKEQFPDNIGLHLFSDFKIPRKIFAGADMVLLPSVFEPGGIVALEALRYGAVPIVRRTGGLNDIVEDFDADSVRGNGFSFERKSAWSLYGAIVHALTIFDQPRLWRRLVRNAMGSVVTWDDAAKEYDRWYRRLELERPERS